MRFVVIPRIMGSEFVDFLSTPARIAASASGTVQDLLLSYGKSCLTKLTVHAGYPLLDTLG